MTAKKTFRLAARLLIELLCIAVYLSIVPTYVALLLFEYVIALLIHAHEEVDRKLAWIRRAFTFWYTQCR